MINDKLLFSNLAAECYPKENISKERETGKWSAIDYEVQGIKGTLLAALYNNYPSSVYLNPKLNGWFRIFIGVVNNRYHTVLPIRLTQDDAFSFFATNNNPGCGGGVEESFWKCADLSGQEIEISKLNHGSAVTGAPMHVQIAWIRFEPMTKKEISDFENDMSNKTNKRIYATNDMHCMAWGIAPQTQSDWNITAQVFEQSDVEWQSVENLFSFDGEPCLPYDRYAFTERIHEETQISLKSYTDEMLINLISHGHQLGIKMCGSHRMGAWGVEYPWDEMYFENSFRHEHPEFRCMDRDGHLVDSLSYVYPEVQDYIIGMFVHLARLGFDAVEMMFIRGVPFMLFEPPFVEKFFEIYGMDTV